MPAVVTAEIGALRERAEEEYRRLLYVGMTRAKERLVVCGTEQEHRQATIGRSGSGTRSSPRALAAECDEARRRRR